MPEATAGTLLRVASRRLGEAGIDTAGLDARLLLQAVLGCDHAGLVAEPERHVTAAEAQAFGALVARRERHEPVSRILGWREFYGRRFEISPAVLDPRPDTETLIDAALAVAKLRPVQRLADLGTGSGIVALTLLAEWPEATALATDRSAAALAVAADNAARLGVAERLRLQEADWWQGVNGRFDLIISNPPYIVRSDIGGLAAAVREHDPAPALDGGEDGLDCYRAIAAGAAGHLSNGGFILLELGKGQAEAVGNIFLANNFKLLGEWKDLGGILRVLGFELA